MKEKVAKKWIEALRSGEYRQTRFTLQDEQGFCCLGVLCKVAQKEGVFVDTVAETVYGCGLDDQPAVMEWSGVKGSQVKLPKTKGFALPLLSALNDSCRLSFDEIANHIAKYWRFL